MNIWRARVGRGKVKVWVDDDDPQSISAESKDTAEALTIALTGLGLTGIEIVAMSDCQGTHSWATGLAERE